MAPVCGRRGRRQGEGENRQGREQWLAVEMSRVRIDEGNVVGRGLAMAGGANFHTLGGGHGIVIIITAKGWALVADGGLALARHLTRCHNNGHDGKKRHHGCGFEAAVEQRHTAGNIPLGVYHELEWRTFHEFRRPSFRSRQTNGILSWSINSATLAMAAGNFMSGPRILGFNNELRDFLS